MWESDERAVKRNLSRYEKTSLPSVDGRALILPGEPDTEVEELIAVGFDPMNIVCVEQEQDKADLLYSHYVDDCHIHWEEVGRFMSRARGIGKYSYLHLDFCGHLKRDEVNAIQAWRQLPAPRSRVRISIFRGRRGEAQYDLEEMLHASILDRLCRCAEALDGGNQRWRMWRDTFAQSNDDTTHIIVALAFMNFFFGLDDIWAWTDECTERGEFLPPIAGSHNIASFQRFSYNEEHTPNHMYTAWVDLEPLPAETLRRSKRWLVDRLAWLMSNLTTPTPSFNPIIYNEEG